MSEIPIINESRDPAVKWDDLKTMPRWRVLHELTLPLPWLAISCLLYASPVWPLGAAASFMFFLTALRLNHEAIHANLTLPRWADNLILHVLSVLIMASNHAVAHSHMIHHRFEMGPGDYEGKCGEMSVWQVLIYGPKFPVDLTRHALMHAPRRRKIKVLIDWALIVLFASAALALGPAWLKLHIAAMVFGQCMTAFFAVWITHHGAAKAGAIARSQRGPVAQAAYLMFYHREHHLYPAVPVHQLPKLAARLDAQVPGYTDHHLPVVPILEKLKPAQLKG